MPKFIPDTSQSQPRIALLGLGAMGRRMAQRLLSAGFPLATWSRSGLPADCDSLASTFRADARQAVAEADIVLSMVRDDAASRELWLDSEHGALESIRKDTLVLECSTVTPDWALELGAAVEGAGGAFLDAPVLGSRPQAEAGQLIFLVGGEGTSLSRAEPIFEVCGSAHYPLGQPGAGARLKLVANALFAIQVATLAELLPTLAPPHSTASDRAPLLSPPIQAALERLPVLSPAALGALRGMLAAAFDPMFPIDLVAKDLGYASSQAGDAPLTAQAHEVFRAASDAGLGGLNLTAIAKRYG
ncbi:MAG: NAD(P)-dependent oxidoreductase [Polyangiaceae bacterium]|nr:NAD(P)-dependent oxidoreductase [Polyangiaceae bacterium]